MEGSKAFSKDFMKKHNIPTAAYEVGIQNRDEMMEEMENIDMICTRLLEFH